MGLRSPALAATAVIVVSVGLRAETAPAGAHARARGGERAARGGAHAAHRPARALKMIWGPVTLPNGQSAFPVYHRLGVQVFQIDLNWAETALRRPVHATDPADPAYQWPATVDTAVRTAASDGIRVCLLVQQSPAWANGGRSSEWAPLKPADFANFLIAASRRYRTVHYWMVWGEPNRSVDPNFQPMPPNSPVGPRRYALILAAAYHALKRASHANVVIGGNTWSFGIVEPAPFLRWMRLPNGKPPPLDYYGHNPFGRRFPQAGEGPYFPGGRDINDMATLEAQLVSTYHRRVPLWLSEFTISSDHPTAAFDFSVSRRQQAKWLTAAFELVDSEPYVAGLGWFELLDQPPGASSLTNGLLTWSLHRKPDYFAYMHAP